MSERELALNEKEALARVRNVARKEAKITEYVCVYMDALNEKRNVDKEDLLLGCDPKIVEEARSRLEFLDFLVASRGK